MEDYALRYSSSDPKSVPFIWPMKLYSYSLLGSHYGVSIPQRHSLGKQKVDLPQ